MCNCAVPAYVVSTMKLVGTLTIVRFTLRQYIHSKWTKENSRYEITCSTNYLTTNFQKQRISNMAGRSDTHMVLVTFILDNHKLIIFTDLESKKTAVTSGNPVSEKFVKFVHFVAKAHNRFARCCYYYSE
jgi:hypothetical protein